MKRILILGSGGRLGAALVREWSNCGLEVSGLTRSELDISNPDAVSAALDASDFDVLVNCAALTNVDFCETHREEAFRVNAEAVFTIGKICAERGARCIHISTDYVFAGEAHAPLTEEDEARPVSVYGESKLAGEEKLLESSEKHLAVRVSWVFGPDRPSFIDQVVQRAFTAETAEAIGDKWAVPTYTMDVAELLRPFLSEVPEGGILHLCNGGACTWQEYGQFGIDCLLELGVPMKARTVGALKMVDLKAFIAKRPPYTVMSTAKLERLTGAKIRSWRDAVKEYAATTLAQRLLAQSA